MCPIRERILRDDMASMVYEHHRYDGVFGNRGRSATLRHNEPALGAKGDGPTWSMGTPGIPGPSHHPDCLALAL
jgi:hypothetical protein